MIWFDEFIIRAVAAGLGVMIAAAPLGCFVVWRRMAFLGDATAHAALLGVCLAYAFNLPAFLGMLVIALSMALILARLNAQSQSLDAWLGVMAHGALAVGLVIAGLLNIRHLDITAYLFGDILAVTYHDVALIWGGGILILVLLWWRWSRLLLSTLSPELAKADGIQPQFENLIITIVLALLIAIAIQVVGVLLIASLLVIPATAARALARTPESLGIWAVDMGVVSVFSGRQ